MKLGKDMWIQSIITGLGVLGAYGWLQMPILRPYALQAFGVSFFFFFIIKKIRGTQDVAIELGLLTFSFLLIITQTGSAESVFFPLIYILLFLLIFTEHIVAALSTSTLLLFYFIAIIPMFQPQHLASLLSIPLLLVFFFFSKKQYDQALLNKKLFELEKNAFKQSRKNNDEITRFNHSFLRKHLVTVKNLLLSPELELATVLSHLDLLINEIDKVTTKNKKREKDIQEHVHTVSKHLHKEVPSTI